MRCAVKNCGNHNKKKPCLISFFSFPTDAALQKQWKSFCCRDTNVKTANICMEHFKDDDFENNLEYKMGFTKRRFLKQGAVPTVKKSCPANEKISQERSKRIEKRENKKIVELLLKEHTEKSDVFDDDSDNNSHKLSDDEECGSWFQFEEVDSNIIIENSKTSDDNAEIQRLRSELECVRKENAELKEAQRKQTAELNAIKEKFEKMAESNECKPDDTLTTRLTKLTYALNNLEKRLLTIFTKGQIAKLKTGVKRSIWTKEDISKSAALYAASAHLYKQMYKNQFPLPAIRTLQKWAQKVDVKNEISKPVFNN